MSGYEIQEQKMTLSHFRPTMQQPQTAADYIRTHLEIFTIDIHPLDQIELHMKTWEMIYSTLTGKAMMAQRLENSLNNTNVQLQLERASS